jgi:hypothetical protein
MSPHNVIRALKKLSVPPPSVPAHGGKRPDWAEALARLVRRWVSAVRSSVRPVKRHAFPSERRSL